MRCWWRFGGLVASAGLLGACGGIGPLPGEIAAKLPPAVELDPAVVRQLDERTAAALDHLRADRLPQAQRDAQAVLDRDPRAARARAIRAWCLAQQARQQVPPELGLWRRAEGELRLAERLAPTDAEVGLLHARYLEQDGHLTAAAETIGRQLEAHPQHPEVLRLAARLRYELGEERVAAELLERLLVLDVRDDAARYRLAQCRLRLALTGRREAETAAEKTELFARAAATFHSYVEYVPGDAAGLAGEAYARLEIVRLQPGAPDRVECEVILALYARAAELTPSSPEPVFNRGTVLELLGKDDAARRAYRRALTRDPEHLPSLLNLAASLAAADRRDEAAECCRRALRLSLSGEERDRLERYLAGAVADGGP